MLKVRPATLEDALSLAKRLRKADLKEIQAVGYKTPEDSLVRGLKESSPCYVAVDEEDTPHIIFGIVASPDPLLGYVWMMASDELKKHWIQVLRETKEWLNDVSKGFQVSANAVHSENKVHIKWLRWAGFSFLRKVKIGNDEFYEFAKLNKVGDNHV